MIKVTMECRYDMECVKHKERDMLIEDVRGMEML